MTTYRQQTRPTVRPVTLDTIPQEMRETDRWCVWRFEAKQDAKTGELLWNKVPYQAQKIAKCADCTQAATWASFAMATKTLKRDRFDGLFFALGDGWAGVDPDDVTDAETGEIDRQWEDEARAFNSYAEHSPSTRGLRVVLHAAESKDLTYKRGNIEAYDHKRWVSITGHQLAGVPSTVEPRQEQLDAFRSRYLPVRAALNGHQNGAAPPLMGITLEDEALLAKARGAKNGAEIAALLTGDKLDYPTPSEARGGLLFRLAFYTRDPAQLDRLMRTSPLVDLGKWERLGAREIEDALAKVTETYTGARSDKEKSYSKNAENTADDAHRAENAISAFFEYDSDDFPTVDEDMFYGTAGAIVRAIAPHTEASPVALLVQFLVCFGNAAGRHVHYPAEADNHFANLFALIVGDTAKARKGVSWGHIARVYRAAAPGWLDLHVINGLSSGEGIVHAVRNVAAADIPLGDEGELLRDKRLLALESEFATVLGQQKRDGNNLSMVLRDGWDGRPFGNFTKNNPERATDAHLSVIGHITKEELVKRMTNTDAVNGFANRFLYVATKRARLLPHGGDLDAIERGTTPHLDALRAALEWAKTPRRLAHDKEAYDLWECEYERLSTGHPGLFGAVTARAEAQVARIALAHAMLDRSHAVTVKHLRAALALWQFTKDSARYIFADKLGDSIADTILDALRAATADGLTRTELYEQFAHNVPSVKISAALATLLKLRLARMVKEGTGEKGRPAERWFAMRKPTQETQ